MIQHAVSSAEVAQCNRRCFSRCDNRSQNIPMKNKSSVISVEWPKLVRGRTTKLSSKMCPDFRWFFFGFHRKFVVKLHDIWPLTHIFPCLLPRDCSLSHKQIQLKAFDDGFKTDNHIFDVAGKIRGVFERDSLEFWTFPSFASKPFAEKSYFIYLSHCELNDAVHYRTEFPPKHHEDRVTCNHIRFWELFLGAWADYQTAVNIERNG